MLWKKNGVTAIIALAAATAAYFISKNVWITVAAFIISLLIAMNLRPLIDRALKKLGVGATDLVHVVSERGFEHGVPERQIMYALIITQNTALNPAEPAHKALLEELFGQSAAALSSEHEFFRNRYADVQSKKLPLKICTGSCDDRQTSLGRCYRHWKNTVQIDKNFYGRENIDLFFHDFPMRDPDGVERTAVTAVIFYKWNA